MGDEREIDVLSEGECYQLIGSRSVGRMGVIVEGVQVIHPVNYATDGQSIVVKVNPYSILAVKCATVPRCIRGGRNRRITPHWMVCSLARCCT